MRRRTVLQGTAMAAALRLAGRRLHAKLPLGLVLHLWRDAGLTDSVRIVFGLRPSRRHQQRQGVSGNHQFAHDNLS